MFGFKYWMFFAILLSYLVNESMEQKGKKAPPAPEGEEAKKAPPLKPKQIEFAKKWWRELGQEQKGGKKAPGKPKVQSRARVGAGGDMVFFDDLVTSLFPLGDKYGGLPDDIVALGTFCVHNDRHLYNSPVATQDLIEDNDRNRIPYLVTSTKYRDELAELHETFKKRLANSIDKFGAMNQIQKHSCCAWFDWKQKSIATIDPAARGFLTQYMTGLFKVHEIIYCQTFTQEQAKTWCNEFEFMDMQPSRVMPRSWIALVGELFTRFF